MTNVNNSVSPFVLIFVFFIILIIALFFAIKANPNEYNKSKVFIFFTVLASLSFFVSLLFFYSTFVVQENQQKLAVIQETIKITKDIWDNLLNSISESAKVISVFCSSLYPLSYKHQEEKQVENNQTEIEKNKLSNKIFFVWQNLIEFNNYFDLEYPSYINLFLQWATSPFLVEQWNISKNSYHKRTIEFGNLLFKYSQNNSDISINGFNKLAKEFIKDENYISIVNSKN